MELSCDGLTIKILGSDNKLSFDRHISSVRQKFNKARGALNALSSNLSRESIVTINYSLAYSHIVESVIIWGGTWGGAPHNNMGRSIEYKD